MNRKLTRKITFLAVVPVIISMIIFGSISYTIFKENLIKERKEEAKSLIDLSSEEIKNPLYFLELDNLNRIVQNIKKNPNVLSVYIIDSSGRIVTDGTIENPMFDQYLEDEFSIKSVQSDELLMEIEKDTLHVSSPAIIDKKIGTIRIDFSLQELGHVLNNMILLIASTGAVILIVVGSIDISVSRSISGPIVTLKDAATEIAAGNLNTKIEIKSDDEIGELAAAFNKMAHDLKKSNDEIISAKENTDNILSSMIDTLLVVSPDGIIQNVNPAACRLLGYNEKELIGRSVGDVVLNGNNLLHNILENENFAINGFAQNLEKTYLSKDSKKIRVTFSCSIMHDRDKQPRGVVCVAHDITERVQFEAALMESEEKYRDLFENANDAICILDSDLNYKHVNKKAIEMLGYPEEELLRMNVYDVIPHEQVPLSEKEFRKLQEKGYYENFIGKIRNKNGRIIDVEVNSSAIIKDGKVVGSRDIIRDITDRKQMEENIKKSLEEKEVLLREIHHRVKNNMQIISSLLMHQSHQVKDKKIAEIFTDSQNRIMSMSLVHDKLYQSKGLAKIDFEDYVTDIVAGLYQSYGVSAGSIALTIDVENIPITIDSAIPCGLIINELVTNSLKYAFPDGNKGEIRIEASQNTDNMIEIRVGDNGAGIPEQLDFRNSESMGLHLVKILAENQLHGTVSLDRSKGTEFLIRFGGTK